MVASVLVKNDYQERVVKDVDILADYVDGVGFLDEFWDACGMTDIDSVRFLRRIKDARKFQINFNREGIFKLKTFTWEELTTLFSVTLAKCLADPDCEVVDRATYDRLNFSATTDEDGDFGNRDIEEEWTIDAIWFSDGRSDAETEGRYYGRDAATMMAHEIDLYT